MTDASLSRNRSHIRPVALLVLLARPARTRIVAPHGRPVHVRRRLRRAQSARATRADDRGLRLGDRLALGRLRGADVRLPAYAITVAVSVVLLHRHVLEHAERVVALGGTGWAARRLGRARRRTGELR